MNLRRKLTPLALALTTTVGVLTTSVAAPQPAWAASAKTCGHYASRAVKLYHRYVAKGGKRHNIVWNGSYSSHYRHCRGMSLNNVSWLQAERYRRLVSGNF